MKVDYPNYGASLDTYPVDTGRLQGFLDLVVRNSDWGQPLRVPWCSSPGGKASF